MGCGTQIDLQLESGEYFLAQDEKAQRAQEAQQQKQFDRVAERKRKREAAFEAPAQVRIQICILQSGLMPPEVLEKKLSSFRPTCSTLDACCTLDART
jgi:hypothetical protein